MEGCEVVLPVYVFLVFFFAYLFLGRNGLFACLLCSALLALILENGKGREGKHCSDTTTHGIWA